jgi:hypothetical protein
MKQDLILRAIGIHAAIFEWEKPLGGPMREALMPEWNSEHSVGWRAELARPAWNWAVMVHGTGRVSRERKSCAIMRRTSDGITADTHDANKLVVGIVVGIAGGCDLLALHRKFCEGQRLEDVLTEAHGGCGSRWMARQIHQLGCENDSLF